MQIDDLFCDNRPANQCIMACSDGVEQCIFLMRHGERQDGVDRNWKKTALRPYDTPLSQHAHYETPKLIKERLTGKVG